MIRIYEGTFSDRILRRKSDGFVRITPWNFRQNSYVVSEKFVPEADLHKEWEEMQYTVYVGQPPLSHRELFSKTLTQALTQAIEENASLYKWSASNDISVDDVVERIVKGIESEVPSFEGSATKQTLKDLKLKPRVKFMSEWMEIPSPQEVLKTLLVATETYGSHHTPVVKGQIIQSSWEKFQSANLKKGLGNWDYHQLDNDRIFLDAEAWKEDYDRYGFSRPLAVGQV
jgi:hypothetical protein